MLVTVYHVYYIDYGTLKTELCVPLGARACGEHVLKKSCTSNMQIIYNDSRREYVFDAAVQLVSFKDDCNSTYTEIA